MPSRSVFPTAATRRDFLAGAAGAGASLALGLPASNARAEAAPKLRVGMIGVGGKGEHNFLQFRGLRCDFVALCDVDAAHAKMAFTLGGKAARYIDYREMLEKEAANLEAVVVSTPDHHHAAAAIRAMKLGKHVYCEKPMAHSIYEARRMRDVARETGVMTQMGNHGHAGTVLRRAVEIVQSGAIGEVREFHAWTDRPSWPSGVTRPTDTPPVPETLSWNEWIGPAPERPYHPAYCPRSWRGWWDFGTGALGDMACHVMDLGFWALNLEYPISVEPVETTGPTGETFPGSTHLKYEFPARGALPPVTLHWYDGGKLPDAALAPGQSYPGNGSILVGSEGTLYVPDTYGALYTLLPEAKFASYEPPAPTIPRAAGHHKEFVEACQGGPAPLSNFEVASRLTESVLLGNIALKLGRKIEWDAEKMLVVGAPEADVLVKPPMREGWEI